MNKKKKVFIIAPYGFNDRMKNFVEYVSARLLAKNGWQVVAMVKSDNGLNIIENIDGIKVYRYASFYNSLFFLLRIFIGFRPTIVHFHNLRNNRPGIIASIIAKMIGCKLFFTEYGLLHDHFLVDDRDNPFPIKLKSPGIVRNIKSVFLPRFLNENLKNYFFHWPMSHANKIIFVSTHNLPIAEKLGFKKDVIYLPQILDDASWNYSAQDIDKKIITHHQKIEKEYQIFKEKKYAVFVGQIKYRKGWDILLKAISQVKDESIEKFIFISPSYIDQPSIFSDLVSKLNIADRVMFLGKISDRKLLKLIYDSAEVIIVPSRYEGFGLVVTEAFEVKKPLIATDIEAINETVIDNFNGLMFPKEDSNKLAQAINNLANDFDLKNKLVNGGLETLEKFKSKETKNLWLDFYNSQI